MQRFIRALGCCAVASSLAACVVTPQQSTQSRPAPNPHELAAHRLDQIAPAAQLLAQPLEPAADTVAGKSPLAPQSAEQRPLRILLHKGPRQFHHLRGKVDDAGFARPNRFRIRLPTRLW